MFTHVVILSWTMSEFDAYVSEYGVYVAEVGKGNKESPHTCGETLFHAKSKDAAEAAKHAVESVLLPMAHPKSFDFYSISEYALDHLTPQERGQLDQVTSFSTHDEWAAIEGPNDSHDDHGTADGFDSDAHRDMWEFDSIRYGDN